MLELELSDKDDADFSTHLNTLHNVLSRYSVCHKDLVDIVPKISLSGYRKRDGLSSVFDMLFPNHPHQAEGKPCNWQNAVVHVGPEV